MSSMVLNEVLNSQPPINTLRNGCAPIRPALFQVCDPIRIIRSLNDPPLSGVLPGLGPPRLDSPRPGPPYPSPPGPIPLCPSHKI